MQLGTNSLNWFEIPVTDMDRAKKFYETIFGIQIEVVPMGDFLMGMFPYEMANRTVNGALVKGEWYKPSMEGTVVYLNGNPDLDAVLGKVEGAGGKIMMPKTQITPEIGHMAFFIDSEGNRMALHSQN